MKQPIQTPVGAGTLAAAIIQLLYGLLSLWPAWSHLPAEFRDSADTFLTALAVYLAGWASVVTSPGQKVSLELTQSPLPTLQRPASPGEPPA